MKDEGSRVKREMQFLQPAADVGLISTKTCELECL